MARSTDKGSKGASSGATARAKRAVDAVNKKFRNVYHKGKGMMSKRATLIPLKGGKAGKRDGRTNLG